MILFQIKKLNLLLINQVQIKKELTKKPQNYTYIYLLKIA